MSTIMATPEQRRTRIAAAGTQPTPGSTLAPKPPVVVTWTPDRVDTLRSLWADGVSGSGIAEKLGGKITRSAVLGKAHRLGLLGRYKPPQKHSPRVPAKAKVRKPRFVLPRPVATPVLTDPPPPLIGLTALTDPPPPLIGLTALTDDTCRYPVGDPRVQGFGFCGVPVRDGSVYCAVHHSLTHLSSVPERAKGSGTYRPNLNFARMFG